MKLLTDHLKNKALHDNLIFHTNIGIRTYFFNNLRSIFPIRRFIIFSTGKK